MFNIKKWFGKQSPGMSVYYNKSNSSCEFIIHLAMLQTSANKYDI